MLCKNVFGISFFRKDSMKVNMDKIRQYEGCRKNIIQIGEYIMMWSRRLRFGYNNHRQDLDRK